MFVVLLPYSNLTTILVDVIKAHKTRPNFIINCIQRMNAMAQNWNKGLPYVFPPSSMVSREVPLFSNCQHKLFSGLFKTI